MEETSYSVGWLALSLINAGLAQSKNRSGLAWWAGSLLLGPVATLLVVLSPRLEPGQREAVSSRFVLIGVAVILAVLALLFLGTGALGR